MSGERKISILIDTQGNVSGIDAVTDRFKHSEGAASHLFETLKAGAAIDIGGRLVEGVARIPESFQRAIDRGVEFNRRMQDTQINVAAMLKQFDASGRLKTFDDALAQSGDLLELFRRKAKESSSTLADLLANYQVSAGTFAQAAVPLEKQVELTEKLTDALDAMGIHSDRARLELRALFAGDATGGTLMKRLGITPEELAAAKSSGQLFDFLSAKTAGYSAAGARASQTLSVATAKLGEAIDEILGKVSKPVFEAITKGTLDLTKALDDPAIAEDLRSLGEHVAALTKTGYDLTKWAVENSDVLVFLAKAAAGLGATLTAIKLTNFILDLGRQAVAFVASKTAIDAETAALARNTVAQAANAAVRKTSGPIIAAGDYGRTIAAGTDSASAAAKTARAANLGRYIGPVAPTVATGAGEAAAGGAVTSVASVASVVLPLAVAFVAGWFIRSQMLASSNARTAAIEETGNRYSDQTMGNTKAMSSMATLEDKLAVSARIRAQMAQAEADRYDYLAQGDEKRVQMADQQLVFLEKQHSQLDAVFERVHAIAGEEADRLRLVKETADFIKSSNAQRIERQKDLPAARTGYQDAVTNWMGTDTAKLARLREQRKDLPSWTSIYAVRDQVAAMPNGIARDSAEDSLIRKKTDVLNIEKQIEDLEKKIAASIADQVKKLGDQAKARQDYVLDFQILQAQAAGNDAIVKTLEHQKALREEIRKIMDATGVTEAEAARAATRKLALQDQIAAREKAGATPPVNRLPASGSPSSAFRPGITGGITTHHIGEDSSAISSFDYRNNGIIGGFGRVVPRIAKPPAAAAGASDIGGLSDAVKRAQEEFDRDGTLAAKKKLTDEINLLTAALANNKNKDDPVLVALTKAVADLRTQVAGLRAR